MINPDLPGAFAAALLVAWGGLLVFQWILLGVVPERRWGDWVRWTRLMNEGVIQLLFAVAVLYFGFWLLYGPAGLLG